MTLLILLTMIALQGGVAVADSGDCTDICFDPTDGDDSNDGP